MAISRTLAFKVLLQLYQQQEVCLSSCLLFPAVEKVPCALIAQLAAHMCSHAILIHSL